MSNGGEFCELCVKGKIQRSSFPTDGRRRGRDPLSLVHSDICGKVAKSLGGSDISLHLLTTNSLHMGICLEMQG